MEQKIQGKKWTRLQPPDFDKDSKNIHWKKKESSINSAGETVSHVEE